MRTTLFAFGLVVSLACAATARAQPSDTALAETLYQQGRALMDQKKYDDACLKFAESHRLEPATGTLLNLASCNEARGKLATAWAQYNDAVIAARRDNREDRVQFARERIAAIEPKLARVTITVPEEAEVAGLEVRFDGVVLGKAAWGVPAPTDTGKHTIEAVAPRKKPWSVSLQLGDSEQKTLQIPVLVDAPPDQSETADETTFKPVVTPPTHDRVETDRPVPSGVWIAGGATVLLAIGTGVSGVLYLDKRNAYEDANSDPSSTVGKREDARDEARTWGVMNGVLGIATLVGAAATGYLYVTRPEVKKTSVRVTPWMSPRAGGLALSAPLF
jgi:hypothetical protein